MIRFALVGLSLCAALSLTACKQGLGDRCQVTSDCDSGLICVLEVGATPQTGGTCSEANGHDMATTADFATTLPDLLVHD